MQHRQQLYWAFHTNVGSVEGLRDWHERRLAAVGGWTVGSRARPGDLAMLYCQAPALAYVAVARVLDQSVRSQKDNRWWANIETMLLPEPLTYHAVRRDRVMRRWESLKSMQGSVREIPEHFWQRLLHLSIGAYPLLQRRAKQWERDSKPSEDLEPDLHLADWDAGRVLRRSSSRPETHHQLRVRDTLSRMGIARPLSTRDRELDIPASFYLGRGAGYPDFIMRDLRTRRRTLIVGEVKIDANPGRRTDGVTQLVHQYVPALTKRASRWELRPMLVALSIHPQVLRDAARHNVECWRFDDQNATLEPYPARLLES